MANTYTWEFVQLDTAPTEGSLSDEDWCKTQVLANTDKTEAELKADIDTQLTELDTPTSVGKLPSSW